MDVVHTRTLANPDWGVKLSGKEGKNTLGIFTAQDNITNYLFPGSEGSDSDTRDRRSFGTALRYKRDISRSSNVGVLVTDREGEDYYNRVGGIDGDFKFTPQDRLLVQYLHSQTAYPGEITVEYEQPDDSFQDDAYFLYYNHNTRNYNFYTYHRQVDKNFRSDLGFITQAGFKYSEAGGSYKWQRDPGHWFTWLSVAASFDYRRDQNDRLQHRVVSTRINYEGPFQSHGHWYMETGKDRYDGVEFNTQWMQGCMGFRPAAPVFVHFYWRYGDQIDYANTRLGTRTQLYPSLEWSIGMHLRMETAYTYERLDVEPGCLYEANVARMKLIYQLSKRMFVRGIFQYKLYDRNPALYIDDVDPKTEKLFNQFLFSYKINPQTVFFLGYADDYYEDHIVDFTQTNRTVFAKLGYAWRL